MAIFKTRFLAKSLLRKVEVNVVIPTLNLHQALSEKNERYYRENEIKYPLLILLSGFSDDNEAWLNKADIQGLADEYKVAIAMLSGENKWYLNVSPIDNWSNLINIELHDFLYGNFNQLSEERPLIIGGVSMGGYGALYNGLKNISKYDAILALSPGIKPDPSFSEEVYGSLKDLFLNNKDNLPYVYLSVGTEDFIIKPSEEFDNWLKENEIGVNYNFKEGFDHSWKLWKLEIEEFLKNIKHKNII